VKRSRSHVHDDSRLLLSPPTWRSARRVGGDIAAAILFVFAALTVESGLLVAVVVVAAPGERTWCLALGIATIVPFVAGYLFLRFVVLHVGAQDSRNEARGSFTPP
jgi:hypothetical protein